jgi:hypothetical protein
MKKAVYWVMFALGSAGMLFIFYEALPLYRTLIRGSAGVQPGRNLYVPAACVVIVMQACYWINRKTRPPLGQRRHIFLGHVVLFLARLSFIFAGSLLSIVTFTRSADTRFSVIGIALLLAVTFAQFCYARELEALSASLEGR